MTKELFFTRLKKDYALSNKPKEIEGFWDTFLIRPSGFVIAWLLKKSPIHPTHISILSVVSAGIAAYYYYLASAANHTLAFAIWGFVFFWLSSAFDSADGQLARMTNRSTTLGRAIDGVCDNLSFFVIYVAIFAGYCVYYNEFSWPVFGLALLAGLSHSIQSSLTDYQRGLFVHYTLGKSNVAKEEPAYFRKQFVTKQKGYKKLLTLLQLNHAVEQRWFCRSSHQLYLKTVSLFEKNPDLKNDFGKLYQQKMVLPLKLWALLGPNAHKIGIIVAAFLPYKASFWGHWGMSWYFLYELIALNLIMVGLIFWQKKMDNLLLGAIPK